MESFAKDEIAHGVGDDVVMSLHHVNAPFGDSENIAHESSAA